MIARRQLIKQSLDNLPSAICFANHEGLILLSNHRMNELVFELTGHDLQHLDELQGALSCDLRRGPLNDPWSRVIEVGDRLWDFTKRALVIPGWDTVTEIHAHDVTVLHQRKAELERENLRLSRQIARAEDLSAAQQETVREEESLAMKIRVHSDLGLCLLASGHCVSQDTTELETYHALGRLWSEKIDLFSLEDGTTPEEMAENSGASAAPSIPEMKAQTLERLALLGLTLEVDGPWPPEPGLSRLLLAGIRECGSNIARHTEGSTLKLRITERPELLTAEFTNDGPPPQAEIREGGGLSSLRARVERAGGAMQVESAPTFRLLIQLPKGSHDVSRPDR